MRRIDSPLMREIDAAGYRREYVASVLGVGPWTLSRIERGSQNAPDDFYARAAAFLRIPVERVLPRPTRAAA